MTSDDNHDSGAVNLRRLTALAPESGRAERVRAKCRTQLEQGRHGKRSTALATEFAWRVLAPIVVGVFCAFYIAVLVATTIRFEGLFD